MQAPLRRGLVVSGVGCRILCRVRRCHPGALDRDLVGAQYYNKEALARENAEAIARVEGRLDFLATASSTPDRLSEYEVRRIEQVEGRALNLLQLFESAD